MMVNTRDFSKFGARERNTAGELLTALHTSNDKATRLSDNGISIEFNLNSGMVFLVDEDCNVAVMEGDKLVDFLSCPQCGTEGTPSDFAGSSPESCCVDYLGELYIP
jgi:hypothetical protein